jgi:flagellar motility protein MotE (MotC chaperone)
MKLIKSGIKVPGMNPLSLMILMFLGSATLRIAVGADEALAQANPSNDISPTEQAVRTYTDATTFSAPIERERLSKLLELLKEKEARISQREEAQNTRQKALDDAAEENEARLAEIKGAEQSLRETLTLSDSAAEDDLSRLTSVYESMKSKDAAPLFEAMEPEFAAGFLGRMRPDAAANIMAGLNPDFAYTISVHLAGRNAQVKKN